MITIQALASELGVNEADVEVYVEQLISLDGEAATVADAHKTGAHQGSYPIWVVTLSDEAEAAVRTAVAAQREVG